MRHGERFGGSVTGVGTMSADDDQIEAATASAESQLVRPFEALGEIRAVSLMIRRAGASPTPRHANLLWRSLRVIYSPNTCHHRLPPPSRPPSANSAAKSNHTASPPEPLPCSWPGATYPTRSVQHPATCIRARPFLPVTPDGWLPRHPAKKSAKTSSPTCAFAVPLCTPSAASQNGIKRRHFHLFPPPSAKSLTSRSAATNKGKRTDDL